MHDFYPRRLIHGKAVVTFREQTFIIIPVQTPSVNSFSLLFCSEEYNCANDDTEYDADQHFGRRMPFGGTR